MNATILRQAQDNFDLTSSHVLPALIRKFHDAKVEGKDEVVIWGTGKPKREFLHVDDLADACLFVIRNWEEDLHINIGTGEDQSIGDLARMVQSIVYPEARLVFDATKPDGTPRKLLNVNRLHTLGWHHRIQLVDGIRSVYDWFLEHMDAGMAKGCMCTPE